MSRGIQVMQLGSITIYNKWRKTGVFLVYFSRASRALAAGELRLRLIFGGFLRYFQDSAAGTAARQVMLINLYRGVGFGVFLAYFYELHKAVLGPCFGHDQVWGELQTFFPEIRGPFSHIYQQSSL